MARAVARVLLRYSVCFLGNYAIEFAKVFLAVSWCLMSSYPANIINAQLNNVAGFLLVVKQFCSLIICLNIIVFFFLGKIFYLLYNGLMFLSMHMLHASVFECHLFAPLTQRGVCWFWSRAFISHQCFISQSLIQQFVCPSTKITSSWFCVGRLSACIKLFY